MHRAPPTSSAQKARADAHAKQGSVWSRDVRGDTQHPTMASATVWVLAKLSLVAVPVLARLKWPVVGHGKSGLLDR